MKLTIAFLFAAVHFNSSLFAQIRANEEDTSRAPAKESVIEKKEEAKELPQPSNPKEEEDYPDNTAVFWTGEKSEMTFQKLAALCAPVFWYSSDEMELHNKQEKAIDIPKHYEFEKGIDPIVYYQMVFDEPFPFPEDEVKDKYTNRNTFQINLKKCGKFRIDYIHYYKNETGPGKHKHDNEMVMLFLHVKTETITVSENAQKFIKIQYKIILDKIIAKAHALAWYDNIIIAEKFVNKIKLPLHILVEEGKHASCIDINADGKYTPGYDVNVRINDAWGVRDNISTGNLSSPVYHEWMTKQRDDRFKVIPDLPDDSPYLNNINKNVNTVYTLRPMPKSYNAYKYPALQKDMEDYVENDWPFVTQKSESNFFKNFYASFRQDSHFPGFSILNAFGDELPYLGGWICFKQDIQLKSFENFFNTNSATYTPSFLYTPSASRFFDQYFAVGWKMNYLGNFKFKPEDVVFEYGFKIRLNTKFMPQPIKFLSNFHDLWGIRIGIKNTSIHLNNFNFVFEFGAGEF